MTPNFNMIYKESPDENTDWGNGGFQAEVIRSPDISNLQRDDFIEKLQRLSEKQN